MSDSSTSTARANSETSTLPIHSTRSTPATEPSPLAPADSDSNSESSSSDDSTSEDDTSEEEDDEEEERTTPTTVPTRTKPIMSATNTEGAGDLKSRLAAFLPQLAASNQKLEELKQKGELKGFEDVEEGKDYIEMDLGLGVLEEKNAGQQQQQQQDDGESEEREGEGKEKEEVDVLRKMMGIKTGNKPVGISEIE